MQILDSTWLAIFMDLLSDISPLFQEDNCMEMFG